MRDTVRWQPSSRGRVGHAVRALQIMRMTIVTIFPEFFSSPMAVGVIGRAVQEGILDVDTIDPRRWGRGAHRQVDDAPFGGGAGMVMMVEPIDMALAEVPDSHKVLLSAAGRTLTQSDLDRFATMDHVTLVCGRYEGVDQRVADHLVDDEISLGDFVLAGGEAAALAIVEGTGRLVPGVLGNPSSIANESFRRGEIEEPVYTRPACYRGWDVPEVLLSGDHARIEAWRGAQRSERSEPGAGRGQGIAE